MGRALVSMFTELDYGTDDPGAAILCAKQEECRRIARELHDETAQQLVVIGFKLLELDRVAGSAEAQEIHRSLESALASIQTQIRTLSHLQRPPELTRLGLRKAIAAFAENFGRLTRISVNHELEECRGLSPEIETALYLVAQESLSNVARHSRATGVQVRAAPEAADFVLEILDNGVGISPAIVAGRTDAHAGVGLRSMRARMAALGGRLEITRTNPGTAIRVSVPQASYPLPNDHAATQPDAYRCCAAISPTPVLGQMESATASFTSKRPVPGTARHLG